MSVMDEVQAQQPIIEGASLETFRSLVTSAFEAARASGRSDWQVMTVGVLKNRILQATAREFDERSFGAASFSDLLRQVPDLVELDDAARPPVARLLAPSSSATPAGSVVGIGRLRPDLWDAVLDYSSGEVYVWDGVQATKVAPGEAAGKPQLPTIKAEVMAGWRRDFAKAHADRDLAEWVERGLGTVALPPDLRRPWNLTLKSKVVDILAPWFEQQGLSLPAIASFDASTRPSDKESQEAEELRRFLLRCVAVMKPGELKAMQVPASVALRAKM